MRDRWFWAHTWAPPPAGQVSCLSAEASDLRAPRLPGAVPPWGHRWVLPPRLCSEPVGGDSDSHVPDVQGAACAWHV